VAAFTNYAEDKIMDFLFNNGAALGITTAYVKLHLGAPGEDATANAATETTRKAFTVAASSGGVVSNEAAITWTSYPAAETVSHISIWDAAAAGNPLMHGALTASKVMAIGDTLDIAIGELDLSVA
jgi:hypothetical protein